MPDEDPTNPRKRSRRTWVILAVVVAVLAAAGLVGGLVATSSSNPTTVPRHNCVSSGCGLVSQSLTVAQPTGFYGASCTGIYGSWFLKVMQEANPDQFRADYNLRWELSKSAPIARPSGTVLVRPPKTASGSTPHVALTLNQGMLTLNGTDSSGKSIHGTGTLTVRATGTSATPTLKFVETGLSSAEKAVGYNSPFDVDGKPLELLVRNVKVLVGCSR
jgi:hypothetical protein